MSQAVLNIAAGKLFPENLPSNFFLVNLDKMYYSITHPREVETEFEEWTKKRRSGSQTFYIQSDCFEFLSKITICFDKIIIYRFLEHVKRADLLYFIYLLSTTIHAGGQVEVIVPDYKILAKRILEENVNDRDFDRQDIITTTELVNEPDCPHSSIWTEERAKYYFEYERRFKVINSVTPYHFDGRSIYLKFIVERLDEE